MCNFKTYNEQEPRRGGGGGGGFNTHLSLMNSHLVQLGVHQQVENCETLHDLTKFAISCHQDYLEAF